MSIFKDEKTPYQLIDNGSIKDKINFRLFRSDLGTPVITITSPGNIFTFLPKTLIQGPGSAISKYIIESDKNIIESYDTTDFKINMDGIYSYFINIAASVDNSGFFVIQLVDADNNVYNNTTMETFGDILTNSKPFYLHGIIQHKKNDVVKIRFQTFSTPNITDVKILTISQINCIVELI